MNKKQLILLSFLLAGLIYKGQNPSCPSPYVYMDGGTLIKYYDPGLPLSATNPNTLNIPTFGGGLTLMPNINGGTLSPTFYSTSGGTYWYWNGATWVNTGHSTGNGAAVNIAGCNGAIYNIVGGSGQVYVYNGTGNGTLLTTLTGFNGGGPYDLVTDCNCNFYALNTTAPNQTLTMYNASGAAQCTYTLNGMPNTTAGGGFAIIGNTIYVKNNIGSPGGFYVGEIVGSSITFTAVPNFTNSPGDFASCPVCYSSNTLSGVAALNGGAISCNTPSVFLVATSLNPAVTYSWSGPGLIGPTNTSLAVAGSPGVYYCTVSAGGCPPAEITVSTTVGSNTTAVLASISPSGNICMSSGSSKLLTVAHSANTDIITWRGPAMTPVVGSETLNVTSAGSYTVHVQDPVSGCFSTDVVNIVLTPTVALAVSDYSLCTYSTNGSPASITITASGASSYTFSSSGNLTTSSPNGSVMPCFVLPTGGNPSAVANVTIIGSSGFCRDTAFTNISILQNPTVVCNTSYSICPGGSQQITVSGAIDFIWTGSPGLNTYNGASVTASPASNAVYSVTGSSSGCNSATRVLTVNILPIPSISISPGSSTVCFGSSVNLIASGNATTFSWTPSASLSSPGGQTVIASPQATQQYTVVGSLNTCTNSATAVINIVQPPTVGISLSTYSLCANNFNGSPTSVSLTPSGAQNYTLLAPSFLGVTSPAGPVMRLSTTGPQSTLLNVVTVTLIGVSGVCSVTRTETLSIIPNPTLTISPPSANICPGKTQAFVASGATFYNWQAAPNYSLTSANSILAFPPATSFYSVYGIDAGCRSDTKSAVLVVLPIPEVTITPRSTTVCAGNSVPLIAGGNGTSYLWSPASTLSSFSGGTVIATPAATQDYTVVSTLNTCTNLAIATVSVIDIPVIDVLASNYTVCQGAQTILSASGASSYQWFPNNNLNMPAGNVVIATPMQSTSYTVRGYNGICTGSTSIYIKTVDLPNMTIHAAQNEVCKGSRFPMVVRGAQSYTWTPAAGLISNGSDTLVYAAPLTSTNYTVIGANSLGSVSCYQLLSYSVNVVLPVIPTISENINICEGEKVTLRAGGGNTFSWSPAQGLNVTNGSGVVASPSVSTVYTVEISHNAYCGATATVAVNVNSRPTVTAGPDALYNLNDEIIISATGTGTLQWVQGEGIVCTVCPETRVYPTRNTCYIVETTNEAGCRAFDDICLEIKDEFSVFIPNSFSPNNDGINDVFMVYGAGISNISMDIFDRWGTKIFSTRNTLDGWDGSYKEEKCKVDVYNYVISYTGLNRKLYTRTGNVNIIK